VRSTQLEQLRKTLRRRNNQKGFTLIELLVVVSILGILAAVVTMSVVGLTTRAQTQANATEQRTVQGALDTMIADQQLTAGQVQTMCAASGSFSDFQTSPAGHPLFPTYIRQQTTTGGKTFSCDANGVVSSP
jgi:prepilin-type N-terminal cleavage/methylation domain-containing protein